MFIEIDTITVIMIPANKGLNMYIFSMTFNPKLSPKYYFLCVKCIYLNNS